MSDAAVEQLLRRIEANTKEIAEWLQLAYGDLLRERLERVLSDGKRRLAYQTSTGDSSRAVAAVAKVSDRSIREWWKEWADLGLVEETPVEGRFRRKFDLRRLGVGASRRNQNE